MKDIIRRRLAALGLAGVVALSLAACGNKKPSLEEVEQAIQEGTLTVEDALDKGWVDQEWVDSYVEANSVPAADKTEAGAVGEFTTQTLSGEAFTRDQLSPVTFLAFVDPENGEAEAFYQTLKDAWEGVQEAGAGVVLCIKGESGRDRFADSPFPVIVYNDSLREALGNNQSMVEELANTGAWYVNGAIFSAWSSSLEVEDFISSAQSFVQIGAEKDDTPSGGGMTDASTSGSGGALISGGGNSMTVGQGAVSSSGAAAPVG
ncbi:hypothetical protein B5G43_10460 [Flavonifractor sp. An92]|uniref:hypothetical protein n=1 Tax=Flavonifractor sp. An92 TaxID=1965666 RepID=UPI000B38C819|nr:hypothetical protein [Flavonifractor sp. An92]OUN06002.1 hypothetical protein B5G43_10460 [Flavonifractor sp. An92]